MTTAIRYLDPGLLPPSVAASFGERFSGGLRMGKVLHQIGQLHLDRASCWSNSSSS